MTVDLLTYDDPAVIDALYLRRLRFPGEAVFVRAQGARREDDGVALSVVLDSRRRTSFLLVLDARTFAERARAVVPQPVPFGFHGELFS